MSKLRLLVIAPFAPSSTAPHGGSRSIANRLRRAAYRHDVSLLYLTHAKDSSLDPDLASALRHVVAIDRARSQGAASFTRGRISVPIALWRAWRGIPIWAQALRSSAADVAVRDLIERLRPEIIQVEYQVMTQFLPASRTAPTVLVVHEPAAQIAENFATRRTGMLRIMSVADRRAWSQFERRATRAADRTVVFTEVDAAALRASRPPLVVPMTVPLPSGPVDSVGTDSSLLLFVGNYGHAPNVDAAIWACREILPRIREVHPGARLAIVGQNPPPSLVTDESAGIEVTGEVPDVRPWLSRAAVFVVPVRLGGGMRLKTVEALAAGKAVVSTSLGVAGLDVSGDEVVIADSASAFADRVNELLASLERRRALGERARSWAERSLDGEREAAAYEALYAELVADRS